MNKQLTYLVKEHLWQPLVAVTEQQIGLLVQPGSTLPPIPLSPGWHWHWPILTTIRLINQTTLNFTINDQMIVDRYSLADEPVVAATKDLSLVSLEATIVLEVNNKADLDHLALLDKRCLDRRIRPAIRQSLRQAVAEYNRHSLDTSSHLNQQVLQLTRQALKPLPLQVSNLTITAIQPFSPLIPHPPKA